MPTPPRRRIEPNQHPEPEAPQRPPRKPRRDKQPGGRDKPQVDEYELLRKDQILFTYLHLAASEELTNELMSRGVKAVAYETIESPKGFVS